LTISGLTTDYRRRKFEKEFALNKWKHGFIKVKKADHVDNMGAYFCKYLSKDMFDERMFKKKKYFCSQNLNRPQELKGEKAKFFFAKVSHEAKLLFEKEMNSKWIGKVEYRNWKIESNVPLALEEAKKEDKKIDVLSPDFKF